MNPLKQLQEYGQSIWLDYIQRNMILSGELKMLVEQDGVRGVTSNPTIFEKAIDETRDYDAALQRLLAGRRGATPQQLYEALTVQDITMAADVLRPMYDETGGTDGFVSIEVSPHLARDTNGTIAEARRLWREVDRPNLMVKIPASRQGIPAIESCLAEGININITLMFTPAHYEAVVNAFLRGAARCPNPRQLASVASVFVSRIDTMVDRVLERIATDEAHSLRGRVAIANARLIYHRFREVFSSDTFAALRQRGVRLQRVLWGSTSTKNPEHSDVLYVEELIGPDTINTMTPATLRAFREHGHVRGATVEEGFAEAEETMARLKALKIDMGYVGDKLLEDGVAAFAASYDTLLATLTRKCQALAA